jgi:RNA polymerase sigma-70 factor (ECF subfamily)
MDQTHDTFERIFRQHEQRVRDYCARRVPSASVEDIVSETFAVAWRKLDEMPKGEAALPWLYAVAYRMVQHEWRSASRRTRLQGRSPMVVSAADPTVDEYVDAEERDTVLAAAANLPDDDQEILRLTLWEEVTPSDAAVVLGISPDAAKQRAHRARRRLGVEFRRLSSASPAAPTRSARTTTQGVTP